MWKDDINGKVTFYSYIFMESTLFESKANIS